MIDRLVDWLEEGAYLDAGDRSKAAVGILLLENILEHHTTHPAVLLHRFTRLVSISTNAGSCIRSFVSSFGVNYEKESSIRETSRRRRA